MPNWQFWLTFGVNLLLALATFAAVFVALFGRALRLVVMPPEVRIKIVDVIGEKTKLANSPAGHIPDVRYYYIRVENSNPASPITSASLNLVRVEKPGPDGEPQIIWTGDSPIRCRNQELYPVKQDIGSPIDYDAFCITKQPTQLRFFPIAAPTNLAGAWEGPCSLIVLFLVKSAETSSEAITVKIDWDGKWEDGDTEMAKHIKITGTQVAILDFDYIGRYANSFAKLVNASLKK